MRQLLLVSVVPLLLLASAVTRAAAPEPADLAALRAAGLVHEEKGECAQAIAAYSQVLQRDPANMFVLGHRALCHHQLGDDAAALADSERALAANAGWIHLRLTRSSIFFLRNDRASAAREAALLARDNPTSKLALITAALIYAEIDWRREAAEAFERALAAFPGDTWVLINRALSRPVSQRTERLADLRAVLKRHPRHPDALALLAEQTAIDGDLRQAARLFDRAYRAAPPSPEIRRERALVLHKTGRAAAAEAELRALRAEAKTVTDFYELCWAKALAGVLLDLALDECREASRLGPKRGLPLAATGLVLVRQGKLDEAIAHYDRAIARITHAPTYFGRALAYARKGDMARAEADRRQAVTLDPEIEAAYAEYGLGLTAPR